MNKLSKSFHRNLLENYLRRYCYLIKGNILDIGSKNRRYDHLFQGKITAIDIIPKPDLNIIEGNITQLNFEPNIFDGIICLEVFEYLEPNKFQLAFEEIYKVLKPSGKAIISIPFYYRYHKDKVRFTHDFIINYLKKWDKFYFKIFKIGNKYTAIYDMIRYNLIQFKSKLVRILLRITILRLCYSIIRLFSFDKREDDFYSGIFILCTKK